MQLHADWGAVRAPKESLHGKSSLGEIEILLRHWGVEPASAARAEPRAPSTGLHPHGLGTDVTSGGLSKLSVLLLIASVAWLSMSTMYHTVPLHST